LYFYYTILIQLFLSQRIAAMCVCVRNRLLVLKNKLQLYIFWPLLTSKQMTMADELLYTMS